MTWILAGEDDAAVERAAELLFWAEPWLIDGYQPPATMAAARNLARAALGAAGDTSRSVLSGETS